MFDSFSSFIPTAWFDEAGLSKGGSAQEGVRAKRERRWSHSVKTIPMAVISAGVLAFSSLLVANQVTASNLSGLVAPEGLSPVGRAPGQDASLGQINESFKELFSAFRQGVALVTNERTLQLAQKATSRRNERPEGWAKKLASDVEDASD